MDYIVEISDAARKALKKIDIRQASIIVAWITSTLIDTLTFTYTRR